MAYSEIDLHDAILKSATTDYQTKTILIHVEYYLEGQNSKDRVSAYIKFSDVKRVSETTDLEELEIHQKAGNISYWVPADGVGTTYIYLARGLIAITANSVGFVQNE